MMTTKTEPLNNDYKLHFMEHYIKTNWQTANKMQIILRAMLKRAVVPDEPDLEAVHDRVTRERDRLWMFEDVLCLLKTQALSAEQQRVADFLVEVNHYRQALEKNLHLIEELQGLRSSMILV